MKISGGCRTLVGEVGEESISNWGDGYPRTVGCWGRGITFSISLVDVLTAENS